MVPLLTWKTSCNLRLAHVRVNQLVLFGPEPAQRRIREIGGGGPSFLPSDSHLSPSTSTLEAGSTKSWFVKQE